MERVGLLPGAVSIEFDHTSDINADRFCDPVQQKVPPMKSAFDQKHRIAGQSGLVGSIRADELVPPDSSPGLRRVPNPQPTAEQQRRLERFSAIGEMATTLVQEIKAPLNAIGGFARSMMKTSATAVSNKEPLGIIANEVSRLEQLIDNVLGFTQPERLQLHLLSINRLVGETLEILRPSCGESKIEVRLDLGDGLPLLLLDQKQVRQVLENLCANAKQAMPRGGEISVTSRLVGNEVELRVLDTGPGIPKLLHRRVFEPFYSTHSMGTGLGLAVVARVMAGHGGSAFLDGTVTGGAAFCLRFPVPQSTRGSV
jgi:signal transduction histidine kinase